MAGTTNIDPVNRIEGHMGIKVDYDGGDTVTGVECQAQMYRGLENIAYKRPAQDCIQIFQRI